MNQPASTVAIAKVLFRAGSIPVSTRHGRLARFRRSHSVHHSKIKVPYTWSVGETGSKFLRALRDDKKILANKCPDTGQIFCPPKLNSPTTLKPITEWIELAGTGTVKTFTRRHYKSLAADEGSPDIYALIMLDGATQAFPHFLGEVDFNNVKIGMRVEAVFRETRVGHILDIKYFKPA